MGETVVPNMEPVTKFFYAKEIKQAERKVRAVISTRSVDRDGDVILPSAFAARLDVYKQNPVVTFAHNVRTYTVGRADNFEITEDEFSADIEFAPTEEGEKLWTLYKGKFMNAFSAGFMPISLTREPTLPGQTGPTFTEVELIETACVPVPSCRASLQRMYADWEGVAKAFNFLETVETLGFEEIAEDKAVVPFQDLPLDTSSGWSASGARNRLARWASSDGSGDKTKMDWAKYRRGFCYYDASATDSFGSYRLPVADLKGGTLTAIFRGVVAVMGALNGARTPPKITDTERRRIYNTHVRGYYKKADRENDLPELRSFTDYSIETIGVRELLRDAQRILNMQGGGGCG